VVEIVKASKVSEGSKGSARQAGAARLLTSKAIVAIARAVRAA
jgi:hypothetical protein